MRRAVTPEQFLDLSFPALGVSDATEYQKQPPLTTRSAVNVRGDEPAGGGARAGLARWIDDPVHALGDVIQNLDVVVDPQAPRLWAYAQDEEWGPPDGVLDTSTNNLSDRNPGDRYYPPGGSGVPLNKNIPTAAAAPVQWVQTKRNQNGVTNAAFDTALDAAPESVNSLVVVFVRTEKSGASAELVASVTNAAGGAYTRAGGPGYHSENTNEPVPATFVTSSLSAWYRRTAGGTVDETTIRVTPGSTGAIYEVVAVEYRNADTTAPLTDTEKASGTGTAMTAGSLTLDGTTGQMVVAAFQHPSSSYTAGVGYTPRAAGTSGVAANMMVEEKSSSGVGPVTPPATGNTSAAWCGISVALTR
jgi:hypothetical protein